MKDYIKQLEKQNEQLQKKLAKAQEKEPHWVEVYDPPNSKNSHILVFRGEFYGELFQQDDDSSCWDFFGSEDYLHMDFYDLQGSLEEVKKCILHGISLYSKKQKRKLHKKLKFRV